MFLERSGGAGGVKFCRCERDFFSVFLEKLGGARGVHFCRCERGHCRCEGGHSEL